MSSAAICAASTEPGPMSSTATPDMSVSTPIFRVLSAASAGSAANSAASTRTGRTVLGIIVPPSNSCHCEERSDEAISIGVLR